MINLLEKIFSKLIIPAANSTANLEVRDVIGNKTDVSSATVGTASIVALIRNALAITTALQGGTDTIASVADQIDAFIDILRSGQSASYTPTVGVGETTIYEATPTEGDVHTILGCRINLTNMVAGDTLIVRRYVKNITGGAYTLNSDDIVYTYKDVQTVKMIDVFKDTYNTYGCKFVIVQTEGTARAFVCETIDAAPGV